MNESRGRISVGKIICKKSLAGAGAIKGDKGDKGDQGIQGVQGADGKDGTTYTPTIGTITTVDNSNLASASVEVDEDKKVAKFNFSIPKGKDGKDGNGSSAVIDVDTEMSDTSENAVQNKVIKAYVDGKAGTPNYSRIATPIYTFDGNTTIKQVIWEGAMPYVSTEGTPTQRLIAFENVKQIVYVQAVATKNHIAYVLPTPMSDKGSVIGVHTETYSGNLRVCVTSDTKNLNDYRAWITVHFIEK